MKNKLNEWHRAENVSYPILVDKTFSGYVIIRKNIEEFTRDDETWYKFDEKYIPIDEWITYEDLILAHSELAKQRADIDYIMIMEEL